MSPFTPDRLAVVSLPAGDVPALAHFYRDVVGLPLLAHHGHLPAFDLGHGCHLVIVEGQPAPARTGQVLASRRWPLPFKTWRRRSSTWRSHGVELPWGVEAGRHGALGQVLRSGGQPDRVRPVRAASPS